MLIRYIMLAATVSLIANPALAQGMAEYGAVLGSQGKMPAGSLRDAAGGGFNNLSRSMQGLNGGGGPVSGSVEPRAAHMDPDLAASYGKRANAEYLNALKLVKQGKNEAAIKNYDSAITIRQYVWGDTDPSLIQLFAQRAELHRKMGKMKPCEDDYRKVLALQIRRYGNGGPELEKTLSTLASICDKNGDKRSWLNFYRQWFTIKSRHLQAAADELKEPRMKLATALLAEGDYAQAESLLKEAISVEDETIKPDQATLTRALQGYSSLLKATNRVSEAQPYDERLKQLGAAVPPTVTGTAAPTP